MKDKFETGNYSKDHSSGILTGYNKKVVGMMKDEAGGKTIEDFFWLRAKLYNIKMLGRKEEKKFRGVKKHVLKKNIFHEDNREGLFDGTMKMRKLNVVKRM